MKKFFLLFVLSLFFLKSRADEGMWLLPKIKEQNIDSMYKLGFNLCAEEIYSVQNPSLKDAIIIFGKGCTGEIISPEGLILTNHHCGYEAIQQLSSIEHNYLKDGFWAKNRSEELQCKGLTISFLIRTVNLTDSIIPLLSDSLDEVARQAKVTEISTKYLKAAEDSGKFTATVQSFYGGNEYYLMVYKKYKDIRLVGAPPSSIGKFGADTDNWMWPRHTGDFSIFRVYADSTGKTVTFDSLNLPLRTPKFLPISLKGYEKGSYSMILGNPGSTKRHSTSAQVRDVLENTDPIRINVRGVRQKILLNDMQTDPKVRIQYASKYSRSSNYWKHSIGEIKGLKNLNVIQRKIDEENQIQKWIKSDSILVSKYGNCITNIEKEISDNRTFTTSYNYYIEGIVRSIELYTVVRALTPIYEELNLLSPRKTEIDKNVAKAREALDNFYENFNPATDCKVASEMLSLINSNIKEQYKFNKCIEVSKKHNGNFQKFAAKAYKKTFLVDKDEVYKFLNKPSLGKIKNDQAFLFFYSFIEKYRVLYKLNDTYNDKLDKQSRLYIDAKRHFNASKNMYPDANFTMRLTYGTVQDYDPADAVHYHYQTSLKGVFEKEDSSNWEFIVPKKLKEIYANKDFKPYSKNNEMPVCFITNNDITGGNSGSPVINGDGEIIGLAFDGNWDAMSGDIIFEPKLQRTISVDIRYVLLIIDKFGGAGYLLNEMKINQ